jgi:hypothetical protein
MSHPAVLACAILTSEIARQWAETDARFAASEAKSIELVTSSRAAVEHSRNLLSKLKAR